MYSLLRSALFKLSPETSHDFSLEWLGALERLHLLGLTQKPLADDPVEVMGLEFPNRVGLAAGLDKNADYFNALGRMGFGFIEVGTVTPKPQPGNELPRLFRIPEQNAIINRMGFNNKGVDHLIEQVEKRRYDGVLGINIGKNKSTPEAQALDDYQLCLRKVYALADYITVNISSPNTPGLRDLQFGDSLAQLLSGLKTTQRSLEQEHDRYVPIAVKIAPDMTDEEVAQVATTIANEGMDGVVATNTTLDKSQVEVFEHGDEMGGLSGQPLTDKATAVIKVLSETLAGDIPIIGVGGVSSAKDAQDKIDAGASLIQLYTGFIYQGPELVREVREHFAVD